MMRLVSLLLVLLAAVPSLRALDESWHERIARQLQKKVSVEFVDTPISDAISLVQTLTGVNIVLSPELRKNNPPITLRVQDMDAGTLLVWLARLTETHAELIDGAIFITEKPSEKVEDEQRKALMELGASMGVVIELPPAGQKLTNEDALKIAAQLIEKETVKVPDFPGPEIGLDMLSQKNR